MRGMAQPDADTESTFVDVSHYRNLGIPLLHICLVDGDGIDPDAIRVFPM
jgi:hypothetical protein